MVVGRLSFGCSAVGCTVHSKVEEDDWRWFEVTGIIILETTFEGGTLGKEVGWVGRQP